MEQVPGTLSDNQYRRALRSLRAAKNWFAWLLLLALVLNLASLVVVRFWPDFAASSSLREELGHRGRSKAGAPAALRAVVPQRFRTTTAPASMPASAPATMPANAAATMPARESRIVVETEGPGRAATGPATQPATRPAASRAEAVYTAISISLPFALSLGMICAMLVVVLNAMSLLTVLVGRIGDAGYMASALAWSLVLAALMVPWDLAFGPAFMPGALFLRPELVDATAVVTWGAHPDWADLAWYCARFVGYPILAVLIWLLIQMKYSAGVRQPVVRAD